MKRLQENATIIIILNIVFIFSYVLSGIDYKIMPAILFDEFGYWTNGAAIAGYSWKGIILHSHVQFWLTLFLCLQS